LPAWGSTATKTLQVLQSIKPVTFFLYPGIIAMNEVLLTLWERSGYPHLLLNSAIVTGMTVLMSLTAQRSTTSNGRTTTANS
jgi:hypothetical protein